MKLDVELSKRELEVAKLLVWGLSKKQVANRLFISIHTVENHTSNMFAKTECNSIAEFCSWFFCKYHNVPAESSPLCKTLAIGLLVIFLSGEITHTLDNYNRSSRRPTIERCERARRSRIRFTEKLSA